MQYNPRTGEFESPVVSKKEKKSPGCGYYFFLILFMAATGLLVHSYLDLDKSYSWLRQDWESVNQKCNELNDKVNSLTKERDDLYKQVYDLKQSNSKYSAAFKKCNELNDKVNRLTKERDDLYKQVYDLKQSNSKSSAAFKNTVSNAYPMIITDVQIGNTDNYGNVETNYGSTIYTNRTMYLTPRIKYTGLTSGNRTFNVKFYNPDGTISSNSSSLSGFSYSMTVYLNNGNNQTATLTGWGSNTKGHWKRGTYRIEIWYKDVCLKSKTFTVY